MRKAFFRYEACGLEGDTCAGCHLKVDAVKSIITELCR
jgi:hypothetical protein